VEQYASAALGGFPIGVYVKYFALIYAVCLYFQAAQIVAPQHVQGRRFLAVLQPIALLVGLLSLVLVAATDMYDDTLVRFWMAAIRDGTIGVYILAAFIPMNLALYRHEQVDMMRLRHTITLLLCVTYLLISFSSFMMLGGVWIDSAEVTVWVTAFAPLTYLCCLWFALAMLPHRWMSLLLIPDRLLLYVRLRRLHQHLVSLYGLPYTLVTPAASHVLFGNPELAIYHKVIQILDQIHHDVHTYRVPELHELLRSPHDYAELVRRLANLTYV
jgi:hypothetical protein